MPPTDDESSRAASERVFESVSHRRSWSTSAHLKTVRRRQPEPVVPYNRGLRMLRFDFGENHGTLESVLLYCSSCGILNR